MRNLCPSFLDVIGSASLLHSPSRNTARTIHKAAYYLKGRLTCKRSDCD